MPGISSSPPRAPPIKYTAPLGTRWAKETAAAGGVGAFDLPTDPKSIGPWILGECVGKGASGRVKIAKHRLTGQLAAIKILPVAPLVSSRTSLATQQAKTDKQRLGIDREITMMKLMNHPNIMRIYDVYEGDKELFLVLEYVEGGELFDFLVNRGRLPPAEALAFFKQIVYGLNYAHTFSIIHRDLKPENILLASISPPLVKIADWGMAAFAPPSLQLETSCGSPHYASPEIVNGQSYKGNATDIWSCGVILYALLTGRLPFDDKNVRILLGKVKSGKYDMPAWIDPLAKDLLGKMLVVDVEKRITIPEILSHPWLHSPPPTPVSAEQQAAELAIMRLPPSPSTLARPIASPSLIDPELLASLRVIWGRHTDPKGDSIKRDLCSPAGHGVHAKAFYFLLSRYREDSLRNSLEETRNHGQLETKLDIGSMKFNLGWELDLSSANKRYAGNRNSMLAVEASAPSRTRSPAAMAISGLGPPVLRRAGSASSSSSSRDRASSPAGPRAPIHPTGRTGMDLWRAQGHVLDERNFKSSLNSPKATMSSGVGRGGPRPPPSRRGYTYSHPPPDNNISSPELPMAAIPTPSSSPTPTPTIYAPVPVSPPKPALEMDMMVEMFAAEQKISKELMDMEIDDAVPVPAPSPEPDVAPGPRTLSISWRDPAATHGHRVVPPAQERGDKENQNVGDESWSYVDPDENKGRGIGLGMGREAGRAMGNVTNTRDAPSVVKGRREKEKKSRPPTLDFRNLNQHKRSTVLGSPMSIASPVFSPTSTSRLITSPVVGEFKGWFSNLFSWKNHANSHGGILYSHEDVYRTRADVGRLFEGL
ncbi:kinase-like domain-containing protein, partial [Lyophyllum atratum]